MLGTERIELERMFEYESFIPNTFQSVFKESLTNEDILAIGVHVLGRPVGVILGQYHPENQSGSILWVYTKKSLRRQGIATRLVEALESELQIKGMTKYLVHFNKENPNEPFSVPRIKGLLQKLGWQEFSPDVHRLLFDIRAYNRQPWIEQYALPPSFEIISWKNLRSEHLDEITKGKEVWYPHYMSPLRRDEYDQDISMLLLFKGKPIGWSMVQKIDSLTGLFDLLYAREPFQTRGRALPLLNQSIKQAEKHGLIHGECLVDANNKPMLIFVDRRVTPSLTFAGIRVCGCKRYEDQ